MKTADKLQIISPLTCSKALCFQSLQFSNKLSGSFQTLTWHSSEIADGSVWVELRR